MICPNPGGDPEQRGKSGRNGSKSPSSDRPLSPLPPKMQFFSGDPSKGSWSSFIIKFERTADRHKWGEDKKLDRLFGCLNDKALEYTVKCKNNRDYDSLKKELELRFDLSDEPVAARHKLGVAKQTDDESLEIFMRRVLWIASDAFWGFDNKVMQQMATEAFLRGCNNNCAGFESVHHSRSLPKNENGDSQQKSFRGEQGFFPGKGLYIPRGQKSL